MTKTRIKQTEHNLLLTLSGGTNSEWLSDLVGTLIVDTGIALSAETAAEHAEVSSDIISLFYF